MRTIWNVVAIMAVLNLLAIGGLFAWLKGTDRLSRERVHAVREAFVKTVAQEGSDKAALEGDAKRKEAEAVEAKKAAQPPMTAAELIADDKFREDQKLQVLLRQQQELANLQKSLMDQIAKLDAREKKLEADKRAFAEERRRVLETEGQKQFQVALATLEGQKPKDAKQVLKALIDHSQMVQVVDYLAKMEEGKRSKVMAEFVKDDATLAADLLERLRTRGVVIPAQASSMQVSSNESSRSTGARDGVSGDQPAPAGAQPAR